MKNRVRELRRQNKWTQSELGEKLQVSRQTINAIENNRYDPSLSLALKIAETFEKTVEEIFKA